MWDTANLTSGYNVLHMLLQTLYSCIGPAVYLKVLEELRMLNLEIWPLWLLSMKA